MKFTKRIATLLMALAMMLCLTVPAFAAENAKLIVKGNQLNGKTVHATKMFTASWVDSDNDGQIGAGDKLSYTLDTAWEGLFWANGLSTGNACPEGSINVSEQAGATLNEKALAYVSSLKDEGETKTLVEFAATAAKYKTTNNIQDTAAQKAENDDSVTFDQLTPGYYLVQPEKGSTSADRKTDAMLVNVPSDKAAELQLKSEYPSVEKKVDTDKTESSAQIGQKVNFTLTSKVPDMSEFDTYYFAFKDTMSKGLTFDESSVTVTIDGTTLTKTTDFTVTTKTDGVANGATEITIEILDMKTKYADKADKTITVTYSATLNKDAVVGNTGNKNEARVEYQNGPKKDDHGTSNPSTTTTRTYPVKVQKHAFEDNDQNTFLAGAKFALSTSKTVPTFTKGDDGSYTLGTDAANKTANDAVIPLVGSDASYRVAEKNDEAGAVTYFTTVGTSATTINGLKAGTYYLHEIEAPEGYNKLTAPVEVTITETTGTDGNVTGVTYTVNGGTASNDSNVKIDNKTGSMLPSTGGMGTIGLTVLGVGVVALGVLAPKKKKEKQ